jgi:hypothetical protein
MAINIKEILSTDSSSQVNEKINYNFDQVVANGGGPVGSIGAQGASGAIGSTGAQGAQGPAGPQGPIGLSTDYFVQVGASPNNFTLTPNVSTPGTATTLVLGETNSASLTGYLDSVLNIKSTPAIARQLRLSTQTSSEYIDINYSEISGTRELQFATNTIGSPLSIDYKFNGNRIILNNSNNEVILSSGTSQFNSNLEINSGLKITSGTPGTGKVLTSSDGNGTATWAPAFEVPLGTIVMIPSFIYNAYTGTPPFNITYTYVEWDPTLGFPGMPTYRGRGKNAWAGWYYCNGKTWSGGGVSYTVPDMEDRLPLGFSKNGLDSPASKDLNSGQYGANSVADLTSVQTADDHTHTLPGTNYAIQSGTGANVSYLNPLSTNTGGAKTVDLSPQTTTVGYMIYLGATNLTYPS